jgi:hypothetical protein
LATLALGVLDNVVRRRLPEKTRLREHALREFKLG